MSTEGAASSSPSGASIAVIIVTHSSGAVLDECVGRLTCQSRRPDLVVVVDNSSPDPSYLDKIPSAAPFRVVRSPRNEGFCRGNNTGYALAHGFKYVLFLNPDAFLSEPFLKEALEWMERPENATVGCLTGTLLGYDVAARRPTGLIDSTGIFQNWYGRWYDRARGEPVAALSRSAPEEIPAACGALMFCRTRALEEVSARSGEVFDPSFFMYKEDIDLSLKMRNKGWRLMYVPNLICHHGRGWQGRRSASFRARYLSIRNELRVCFRNRLRGLSYSLVKYMYVVLIEPALYSIRPHITQRREKARNDAE